MDSKRQDMEGAGLDSESCKNTPFVGRKFDAHHRTFRLQNGCGTQSAQSSPLPHRRLDKLEGVIRDKPPVATTSIKFSDAAGIAQTENSPLVSRKFFMDQAPVTCNCPSGSNTSTRESVFFTPIMSRRNHPLPLQTEVSAVVHLSTPLRYRRRVESDTSRQTTTGSPVVANNMTKSDYSASDMSLMPMRRTKDFLCHNSSKGSPVRGDVLGEPGVFASPARSIAPMRQLLGSQGNCWKIEKEQEAALLGPTVNGEAADQSIVSGWLKFRDNKRVRVVIEGCKFNLPQSTNVLMSFQFNFKLSSPSNGPDTNSHPLLCVLFLSQLVLCNPGRKFI